MIKAQHAVVGFTLDHTLHVRDMTSHYACADNTGSLQLQNLKQAGHVCFDGKLAALTHR